MECVSERITLIWVNHKIMVAALSGVVRISNIGAQNNIQ